MKLTGKQARFVDEYLINPNGTQAAILAGYSAKTARAIASENLTKQEIVEEIELRKKEDRNRLDAQSQRFMDELMKIIQANLSDMFDSDDRLLPPHLWPREIFSVVKSVKYSFGPLVPGPEKKLGYRRMNIQMHDRLKPLVLLGELVGAFPPHRKTKPRSPRR